jgi:hypothetical protein
MNVYSSKQKWKIVLLIIALVIVGLSLWFSNSIVQKVSDKEVFRAKQWAETIKKKAELVELTNRTFRQLRAYERKKIQLYLSAMQEISKPVSGDVFPDYSFPVSIMNENKDIPVILLDDQNQVSTHINVNIEEKDIQSAFPNLSKKEITRKFEDSLIALAKTWELHHQPIRIEVVKGLVITSYYSDSKQILKLESERDSLIRSFNNELIRDTKLIPVVLVDAKSKQLIASNLEQNKLSDENFSKTLNELSAHNKPILLSFKEAGDNELYFGNSPDLEQLQLYPYIQFVIFGLFIFIGYLLFNTFRNAEQNQIWAGMAKETAHQLGTPLSSLMAWVQLLEAQNIDPSIVQEMQRDVDRLDTVSQRFSKIGSATHLEKGNITETIQGSITYLRPRISNKVAFSFEAPNEPIYVLHNKHLMEWVMENIIRNAVDSMESSGHLTVHIHTSPERVNIDISDTGKGIQPKQYKTIFEPGFTTKKRGWGLGLSLVKRIVKEYHKGKVFVLHSELGKGTTFRINLPLDS